MAILLERRSGKDRRRCTLPAIKALGWERRWHREQRRGDAWMDDADGPDDEFLEASWRDRHDPEDWATAPGDG